jgi:hypothetical protein
MAELEAALPAIREEATRRATRQEIVAILSKRFAVYAQPERTDAEWDAWFDDYTQALEDLPPYAIEAGLAEYIKGADSEFFPKPGRIRELARTVPNRMAQVAQLATWAVRRAQSRREAEAIAFAQRERPSEAEKLAVNHMLQSFKREMAERTPKSTRHERPPVSGPTDEHGLTQAMREAMARREQQL